MASDWLLDNLDLIRPGSRVLDVAAGRGRHSLVVARTGCVVHAVDADAARLAILQDTARAEGLDVTTEVIDLEHGAVALGDGRYEAILVFNYLHRPLLPALVRALAPGGVLLYETFTSGQAARGHPRNPAFLLQPGELVQLVAPLAVVRAREGDYGGSLLASVAAVDRARRAQDGGA
jgi:2-polyprenyl-3-methyl-5-hydroxy-6-metoxy-1,4-benzoquinol methylase